MLQQPPISPITPMPAPTDARLPEDENADPVGNGRADADFATAQPPVPGRENPAPDTPEPPPGDDEDNEPPDGDPERHKPGRS